MQRRPSRCAPFIRIYSIAFFARRCSGRRRRHNTRLVAPHDASNCANCSIYRGHRLDPALPTSIDSIPLPCIRPVMRFRIELKTQRLHFDSSLPPPSPPHHAPKAQRRERDGARGPARHHHRRPSTRVSPPPLAARSLPSLERAPRAFA